MLFPGLIIGVYSPFVKINAICGNEPGLGPVSRQARKPPPVAWASLIIQAQTRKL